MVEIILAHRTQTERHETSLVSDLVTASRVGYHVPLPEGIVSPATKRLHASAASISSRVTGFPVPVRLYYGQTN